MKAWPNSAHLATRGERVDERNKVGTIDYTVWPVVARATTSTVGEGGPAEVSPFPKILMHSIKSARSHHTLGFCCVPRRTGDIRQTARGVGGEAEQNGIGKG